MIDFSGAAHIIIICTIYSDSTCARILIAYAKII